MARNSKPAKKNVNIREARGMSYLIHDKLHLTFGQCTQLILTNYQHGHLIANRNIRKMNKEIEDTNARLGINNPTISEWDYESFNRALGNFLEFASSASNLREIA